jgi:protein-S-isoprenylcysteine O-methyltransferase Ste14
MLRQASATAFGRTHQNMRAAFLDYGERAVIGALYVWLTYRLLNHYAQTGNLADLLALPSETMVLVLLLIRRPARDITMRVQDWMVAFAASTATLLLNPAAAPVLGPAWIGWAFQYTGFAAQLWCKAALFRNFGLAPALRGVSVKGPYAFIRHPMYASYFVGQLGFLYAFPTVWNAAIIAVWVAAQFYRMHAEERLLRKDALYAAYAAQVRWRLVPGLY